MDFSFTAEQDAFREMIADYAKRELLPNYTRWDREREFPRETWKRLSELGVTGMLVREEYGGAGGDFITMGIAAEEIGKGDFNSAYTTIIGGVMGFFLQEFAQDAVREAYLPHLARGDYIIGLGLTEPGGGSDAAAMTTVAKRDGHEYVLSGEKSGVSLVPVADAFIVFAKTDPEAGARGVTAFFVPMDSAGVSRTELEDMGNRPIKRGSIFFDGVRVPENFRIGEEGRAFSMIMNAFDFSRAIIALQCVGAAEQSLTETAEYIKQRRAFGRPLAKFQGVSFEIAESHARLELVRLYCYQTLWLRQSGKPHTKQAAICKWLGPQVAADIIHRCVILNGHYGYTQDLPLEQRLRDVIGLEIGDGTSHVQKLVIARDLLGREFVG